MKLVLLLISLNLFLLATAFSQSNPGKAGTVQLDVDKLNALTDQLKALTTSNTALKNDSAASAKSIADLRKKYKSDSLANAAKLKAADTTLAGKTVRFEKAKQSNAALEKDLPFYESEAKRVDKDSADFAAKLRSARDSILARSGRSKQAGDFTKNSAALEKQLAASHASEKSLKDREEEQSRLATTLTDRLHHLQDSLAALDKAATNIASVKAENARLRDKLFGNFQKGVSSLTTGTDFSMQKIADLKAQSQRLAPFSQGNAAFAASNEKIAQFETVSAGINKALDVLQNPYNPASCNAALESLGKTNPLTPEQTTRITKYRSALSNYCAITNTCDSVFEIAKVLAEDKGHELSTKLLTAQQAKIDKATYPFLYDELERLSANAAKGVSIKDGKIARTPCR